MSQIIIESIRSRNQMIPKPPRVTTRVAILQKDWKQLIHPRVFFVLQFPRWTGSLEQEYISVNNVFSQKYGHLLDGILTETWLDNLCVI